MPSVPYNISGNVYQNDGSTAIENVVVIVKNETNGESHNGNDSGFEDLITNSQGEYSTNLGSFTNGWNIGDDILISAKSDTYGRDSETTTVLDGQGGETNISLVLALDEIADLSDAINELGERVDLIETTITKNDDYSSVTAETPSESKITVHFQINEDDQLLVPWGDIKQGEGLAIIKGKDTVSKGDLIRVPQTSGDLWQVSNNPVRYRIKGQNHHYEALMVRSDG